MAHLIKCGWSVRSIHLHRDDRANQKREINRAAELSGLGDQGRLQRQYILGKRQKPHQRIAGSMENQEGRIDTPEIDTINKMMEKLIGGYSLISKAFMVREIAELKDRLDKASYEFGLQRDRIRALEEIVDEKIAKAVETAKIQIRGELTK